MRPRGRASSAILVVLALAAVAACAFALRSVGLEHVFPAAGVVVFENGDGPYHARLAQYSFSNFPAFLTWDSYLAGPLGGAVPWPPGFDLMIAAAARLVGATGIDHVLAWSGPVLGTLGVFAVYAATRALVAPSLALLGAMLYAGFGITIAYSIVGGGDHHCWVSLLGALWLALALWFLSPESVRSRLLALDLGLALVRAAMLLSWSGSLLYVAIADGSLLLVCALSGDVRRLRLLGLGALLTAALVAPVVFALGAISGGPFSTIMLSNLHLTIVSALGALSLGTAEWEQRWPARSWLRRLLGLSAAGVLVAVALASVEAIREQLLPALRFMTLNDASGAGTVEQVPLFPLFGRKPLYAATIYFGAWAYAVPLAPAFALLAAREQSRRKPALLLAAWTAPLAALALLQTRYGNDLGAPAAVCFALALGEIERMLQLRAGLGPRTALLAVAALAFALLVPSLRDFAANAAPSLAYLRRPPAGEAALLSDAKGSLELFSQQVRAATPETPGFDDAGAPEYGLLSLPSIGHSLRYYARRPVAADNFWDKFESYELANGFLQLSDEEEAVERAHTLRARYVVTLPIQMPPASLNQRLHLEDGRATGGRPRFERFRLLTEGPRGGVPLLSEYGIRLPPGVQPYKLFEIVPGAVLEVQAKPGATVVAEVFVETPTERRFPYRAQTTADERGVARLRVPYASQTLAPAHPAGPWRVHAGDSQERSVDVTDADVESGAVVAVPGEQYDGRPPAVRP